MKTCHDKKTMVLYISAWIINSLFDSIIPRGLVALGKWKISSETSYSGWGDGSGSPYYTDKYEHIKKSKAEKSKHD